MIRDFLLALHEPADDGWCDEDEFSSLIELLSPMVSVFHLSSHVDARI
jgi:hypothetical protein